MNFLHRLHSVAMTERLILRRWKPQDLADYIRFCGDPLVMNAAGVRHAGNLSEGETMFHHALRNENCFAIVLQDTGEPIGQIKFQTDFRRPQVNCLSIGYELRRDMWGNGYMTEALQAMVSLAFERYGVDVLSISHFTVNQRSRRVIEKCGFKREGVLHHAFQRFDGQIFDDECYSILKEDYFSRNRTENK